MQDDKISFDTFLKSEHCVPDSARPKEKLFKDSKQRSFDFSFLILAVIAVLSIAACVLYYQKALVPVDNSYTVSADNVSSSAVSQYKNGKVNINTADIETLCTLKYIGESKALEIIAHRITNGEFKDISEIKNVKGIGDATFEKIKGYICV
ncbi:MAG: helix-hairpin-helix domain-containing protein [Oscillospiraceae bacterium]|nr:helix-hairpin-helix domain-containing protein [Oscillospiraceae bacterium]